VESGQKINHERDKKHEKEQRRVRNVKQKDGIVMPVPVAKTDLPDGYANLLTSLKARIQQERIKAVLSANKALVMMYWDIGASILERQQSEGWGAKVIDRLPFDLKEAFPDMKGFSSRNLKYMQICRIMERTSISATHRCTNSMAQQPG